MSQLSAWVDFIFGKMRIRYGEAFERAYGGIDWSVVKADWCEVLESVSGPTITAAIDLLPPDRPPNALQFRAICRTLQQSGRHLVDQAALPAPDALKADPDRMRRIIAGLSHPQLGPDGQPMSPTMKCALNLRRIERENGGLNLRQLEVLAGCEKVCGDTSSLAA